MEDNEGTIGCIVVIAIIAALSYLPSQCDSSDDSKGSIKTEETTQKQDILEKLKPKSSTNWAGNYHIETGFEAATEDGIAPCYNIDITLKDGTDDNYYGYISIEGFQSDASGEVMGKPIINGIKIYAKSNVTAGIQKGAYLCTITTSNNNLGLKCSSYLADYVNSESTIEKKSKVKESEENVPSNNNNVHPANVPANIPVNTMPVSVPVSTPHVSSLDERTFHPCSGCGATGRCRTCHGEGTIYAYGPMSVPGKYFSKYTQRCGVCDGSGLCGVCDGKGGRTY